MRLSRSSATSQSAENIRDRAQRLQCLRRSFWRRAGADVQPRLHLLEDVFCRVAWADTMPIEEREEFLRTHPLPESEEGLWARLLLQEAGARVDPGPVSHHHLFRAWAYPEQRIEYTGLHAAARRAWDEATDGAPEMGAWLYAQAAMFEAMTGELERARAFASVALAHAQPEESASSTLAAASVLTYTALQMTGPTMARSVVSLFPRSTLNEIESWIDVAEGDWRHSVDAARLFAEHDLISVAQRGDGAEVAFAVSAAISPWSAPMVLLAPLIKENRGMLAEQLRWTPREAHFGLRARERLATWAVEREVARILGDPASEQRAQRALDRFRSIVLSREIVVALLLVEKIV